MADALIALIILIVGWLLTEFAFRDCPVQGCAHCRHTSYVFGVFAGVLVGFITAMVASQ